MVDVTGRIQVAFTSGEIDPALVDRTELKYYSSGAKRAENVIFSPQGGFRQRSGFRRVGQVPTTARTYIPFVNSQGAAYDLVASPGSVSVRQGGSVVATISIPHDTADKIDTMTHVQWLDTLLIFHPDHPPHRIRQLPAGFAGDVPTLKNIPTYDYGGAYTNGVAAVWDIQFVGVESGAGVAFTLSVNAEKTYSIVIGSGGVDLAARIQEALLQLPSIQAGLTVAPITVAGVNYQRITFAGDDNLGDEWTVSGELINKADGALVSYKQTVGVKPGEDLMSTARGWPRCGIFYQQRLILAGMKGLPSAWLASITGDYFRFDQRLTTASGPMLIPMDLPGNEWIERIVGGRSVMIFTSGGNYWLADRTLSNGTPPVHVKAGAEGIKPGVPVVESEGAAIFVHSGGSIIGEFRYDEVAGNFVPRQLSMLAAHLVKSPKSMALAKAETSQDGNRLVIAQADGQGLIATLLTEQDVTAFARLTVDRSMVAVGVDGANVITVLKSDSLGRSIQKMEAGLLLDDAMTITGGSQANGVTTFSGLSHLNGREVWAVASDDVFGPLACTSGAVVVPGLHDAATFGTWKPPIVETLPLPRDVGPRIVRRKKARIHTVILSLQDTTSIAIRANGGRVWDVPLARYGGLADVGELTQGFTGQITLQGLTGWTDEPTVRITQTRPGRLHVRSVTIAAEL